MPVNKGCHPRKIPAETVEYLKLNLKHGIYKTAIQATDDASEVLQQDVSVWSVHRHLREAGLIAKKIVKRPALKKKHISACMEYIKKYREWTEEDWALVVWSDESKINRFCSDSIRYIWDDQPGRLTD